MAGPAYVDSSALLKLAVRDPLMLWKLGCAVSLLLNGLLIYWLLFLPR